MGLWPHSSILYRTPQGNRSPTPGVAKGWRISDQVTKTKTSKTRPEWSRPSTSQANKPPLSILTAKYLCGPSVSETKTRSKELSLRALLFLAPKMLTLTTPGRIRGARATSARSEFKVETPFRSRTGKMFTNPIKLTGTLKNPLKFRLIQLKKGTSKSWFNPFLNQSKPPPTWPPRRNWGRLLTWTKPKINNTPRMSPNRSKI